LIVNELLEKWIPGHRLKLDISSADREFAEKDNSRDKQKYYAQEESVIGI